MKKEDLSEIFEILNMIPRETLIRDLVIAPGWSYHGPKKKTQNKIGIGRYDEPVIHIKPSHYENVDFWFFYRSLPLYEVLYFYPSKPKDVIDVSLDLFRKCNRKVTSVENHHQKIIITLDDFEELVVEDEVPILAAYKLYAEALYEELANETPSLFDLREEVDLNYSYQNEPTAVYEQYPYHLEDLKFKKFFFPMNLSDNCIGKVKIVEGEFWVTTKTPKPVVKFRSRGRWSNKGTSLGGIITRC